MLRFLTPVDDAIAPYLQPLTRAGDVLLQSSFSRHTHCYLAKYVCRYLVFIHVLERQAMYTSFGLLVPMKIETPVVLEGVSIRLGADWTHGLDWRLSSGTAKGKQGNSLYVNPTRMIMYVTQPSYIL